MGIFPLTALEPAPAPSGTPFAMASVYGKRAFFWGIQEMMPVTGPEKIPKPREGFGLFGGRDLPDPSELAKKGHTDRRVGLTK